MLNPLFAFIAQTGECLNCWLRQGNTHSANGSAEFLKKTLAQLPKRVWKVIVRADSALFSIEFLRELRRVCCGYVVKVKIRGWKALCAGLDWQKVRCQEDVWTAEFFHKLPGWKTARRFVAFRRLVGMETEGMLFPVPIYSYGLWVTNLSLTPVRLDARRRILGQSRSSPVGSLGSVTLRVNANSARKRRGGWDTCP